MNSSQIQLDFALPIFNPPDNWEHVVLNSIAKLKSKNPEIKFNFILINDGSHSDISKELNSILYKFPNTKIINGVHNNGKGEALRRAFIHGSAHFCVFTDIDFPYSIDDMSNLIKTLVSKKADVILGNRTQKYYRKVNYQRKYISLFTQLINKHVLKLEYSDTQAGLKGFNDRGKNLFLKTKSKRFLFDIEFIKLASKAELNIIQYPINLRDSISIPKIGIRTLIKEVPDLFRIAFYV